MISTIKNISFRLKIFLILSLTVVVSLTIISTIFYQISLSRVEALLGEKLQAIAITGAQSVSVADHLKIEQDLLEDKQDITSTEHFNNVVNQLRKIKELNQLNQHIYTVIAPDWANGEMIFISMTNEKPYVGNSLTAHPLVLQSYRDSKPHFTKIYTDHEGSWISGFAPLLDDVGKVVGVIEIDLSANHEIKEIKEDLINRFVVPAIGILILNFIISFFVSSSVTKPISDLVGNFQLVSKGDLDVKINKKYSSEFKYLMESFNDMIMELKTSKLQVEDFTKNLEQKVLDKTKELQDAKTETENILNNVSQGFFTFDSSGSLGQSYSVIVKDFFEVDDIGTKFIDLINKFIVFDEDKFNQWLTLCFSGGFEFESISNLLPSKFENSAGKHIQLKYLPFYNEGVLERVICIAEDKTTEDELLRDIFEKKEYSEFILDLINASDSFLEFMEDTRNRILTTKEEGEKLLKSISNNEEVNPMPSINLIFRNIHTIKGDSSYHHVLPLKEFSHKIEEELSFFRSGGVDLERFKKLMYFISQLEDVFYKFINNNEHLINAITGKRDNKNIETNVKKFHEYLKDELGQESKIMKLFDETFILKSPKVLFEKFENLCTEICNKQGKSVEFKVEADNSILINPDFYSSFSSSLIHLFRNAIDHGIEQCEERLIGGKNEKGRIFVKIYPSHVTSDIKRMRILISDDGRGLDLTKIKQKVLNLNLLQKDELEKMSEFELGQLIFMPNLSTKDQVTELSGRGVGLDAVRDEVNKINGKILVKSNQNMGTTFFIELPVVS